MAALALLLSVVAFLSAPDSSSCYEILIASKTERTISSENFPNDYANDSEKLWVLKAKETGDTVDIKVNIRGIQSSSGCTKDALIIYDGQTDRDPLFGRYCGSLTKSLSSSGRYIYVHFISDSSGTGPGFQITYGSDVRDGLTTGVIVGITFGCFGVIASVILVTTYLKKRKHEKQAMNRPMWILKRKTVVPSETPMTVMAPPQRCTESGLVPHHHGMPPPGPPPSVTPAPTPYPPTPLVSTIMATGPPAYMDSHYPPLTPAPPSSNGCMTPLDPPPSYAEASCPGSTQVPPPFVYHPSPMASPHASNGMSHLPPIQHKGGPA